MFIIKAIGNKILKTDKKFSARVHDMKTSWFMEIMLCFPLYAFNPFILPFQTFFANSLFSITEAEVLKYNVEELEPER